MTAEDERFMAVALELAGLGRGTVEPNPMAGAVLARGGAELARGWHKRFGGPHAEVEALAAASAAGIDPAGASLYVSLEPCCHWGKTPPCTDALIHAKVARVVAAMTDPDHRVAGQGLAALRQAGVQVACGVLEAQARRLLAPYVKLRTQRRPWVLCKWAQSADGFLAAPPSADRWISCRQSRAYVHQLRGACQAVCVGIGTVLADDPLLTNRSGSGGRPARVVLDDGLAIPLDCRLVRSAGQTPLVVATTAQALAAQPARAQALTLAGAELLPLPGGAGGVDLPALLDDLGRRQWTYLLVEGGAKVLESFLSAGLADELLAFVSPRSFGPTAIGLPRFDIADVRGRFSLGRPERQAIGDDLLMRWRLTEL